MAVAFFGVRRASEVARLVGGDVHFDHGKWAVQLAVKRQRHDQFGAVQMASLITMDSCGVARPVKLLSG